MATTIAPTAESDFKEYTNPVSIASEGDPMRRVSRVMAGLGTGQAELLSVMGDNVQVLTNKMAEINNYMRLVNDGIAITKTGDDNHSFEVSNPKLMSKADALELQAAFNRLGVKTSPYPQKDFNDGNNTTGPYLILDAASGMYYVRLKKKDIDGASKNLRLKADEISSQTQAAQLTLQTLITRYNGTMEVVSATTEKAKTLAGAVVGTFKQMG